ncbi:MAG: hypothetical protein HC886_16520 [Leptolyngbyaceae cyanobacterium SM1_1_3]|nr:hypothetical protein [Leptolyngbyaceae cyanobacterium SM1_1_3]NJN04581.1 hypothetical protein [Leptolyngbyaceae cyanobacterium RM1_1_2]NJO11419.1 hypothetical protein [Leptolyngbyaceae cyanobacterium SL_1_1]
MTPEAIRTISQIRQEFYTLFAAAIDVSVSITKGNSYSSNTSKISWIDRYERLNYVCVYAHTAPDQLLPERPLILRLGINRGLGLEPAKRSKEAQQSDQKLLRFELTLLPDEILSFVPWVADLLQSYEKGSSAIGSPPCLLNFDTLDQLLLHGAWTQRATCAFPKDMLDESLVESEFLDRVLS